jgi:hypothetical protein
MSQAIEKADWLPKAPKGSDVPGWVTLRRTGLNAEWVVLSVFLLILGAGFLVSAAPAVWRSVGSELALSHKGAVKLSFGAAFTLAAAGIGLWRSARRWREPKVEVRADRASVPLGGSARVWWQIKAKPAWLRRLRRLSVLVEAGVPGTGPDRVVVTRLPLAEKSLLSEMVAGHAEVTVPRDGMHSLAIGPVQFEWSVVLRGEVEGQAEPWEQRFEMVVLPAPPGRALEWAPDEEAAARHGNFDPNDANDEAEAAPAAGGDAAEKPAGAEVPTAEQPGGEPLGWVKWIFFVPLILAGAVLLIGVAVLAIFIMLPIVGVMELCQKVRYGRRELKLELEDQYQAYAPGEQVKGWAEWKIDRPPRELVVRLAWNTGPEKGAEVRFEKPQKQERREFTLTLPGGPYSCDGACPGIDWRVELSGAFRTAYKWIAVSPTGRTLKLEPVDRKSDEDGDAATA